MLGVGLVGFTYVLEEAGIRFVGLGGSSSGAVNTMLMAALRKDPTRKCSLDVLKALADTDFSHFLDGNDRARRLTLEGLNSVGGQPQLSQRSLWDRFGAFFVRFLSAIAAPLNLLKRLPVVGVLPSILELASNPTAHFLGRHGQALVVRTLVFMWNSSWTMQA